MSLFTRSNAQTSVQIAVMGEITGLSSGDYTNGNAFQIKNDGDEPVTLEVNLWKMAPGQYVETVFDVGWNPEIVRSIRQNTTAGLNLKYGF